MECPDNIIKVQSLVLDAQDTMSGGDYHSALSKFEKAKASCRILIPNYEKLSQMQPEKENHQKVIAMLAGLENKCELQSTQIQQYIESSDEIKLTESQYLSSSSIYRESDLGNTSMLFSSLDNRILEGESTVDNYLSGYLWDKLEALLGLIQPHAEQFLSHRQADMPLNREEVTMESSFFLLPKEGNGQRILLNVPQSEKHMLDPDDRIKELEKKKCNITNSIGANEKSDST